MARNKKQTTNLNDFDTIKFEKKDTKYKEEGTLNLNDKIKELEDKILSQSIIINSLLLQIKDLSNKKHTVKSFDDINDLFIPTKSDKEIKLENLELKKKSTNIVKENMESKDKIIHFNENLSDDLPNVKKVKKEEVKSGYRAKRTGEKATAEDIKKSTENINEIVEEFDDKENKKFADLGIENLHKEIIDIFTKTKQKTDFKDNFTIQQFVEYSSMAFEFKLDNRKRHTIKNPMKLYVNQFQDKILTYLISNINSLSLREVCTTLFYINCEIDEKYKMVLAMDIILRLKERSKMLYMLSALFNNVFSDGNNDLSTAIMSIASHQHSIEMDLYQENEEIKKFLEIIKINFNLFKGSRGLFKMLDDLILCNFSNKTHASDKLEDKEKGLLNVINYDKTCIFYEYDVKAWVVRLICHILDWDFTYNKVILEKLNIKENAYHTLLAIYLGIDAYYKFTMEDSSVKSLFTEFMYIMNDASEVSQLLYAFLKEIDEEKAEEYLCFYRTTLGFEKVFKLNKLKLF
ncbi:hypothetical protein EHP00_394 [Ecytonucleospora hepatopenaei]|uniref:Uncharacterized protein n=1 Tax=Ecytonucleospora hepatopenaei TaxID=646526 RepID=A0A1W0E9G6_9MICR|nr:hypothetical protein EHP00_394 [Ecytonucleospora hepatopenaei]